MGASSQPWRIRLAKQTKKDRKLLESFSCSNSTSGWDTEVEAFVRTGLFDWTFASGAKAQDPRLLLVFEQRIDRLIGLAAHELTLMTHGDAEPFKATRLQVIALANNWQGRVFSNGARASDVLMSALMTDVANRVPPRDARVFAIIHEDNLRSIALCQRYGLTGELSRPEPHSKYRRLVTRHRATR